MKRKWLKRTLSVLLILLGVLFVIYPWLSDFLYRSGTDTKVEVYEAQADGQKEMVHSLWQNAVRYNQWLSEAHVTLSDPFTGQQRIEEKGMDYESQLALDDSGILAFVEIPAIKVYLPVYHGTSAEVLKRGAGHMEGTALPVGGAGNRPVISAHCGMNTARMFSDLSQLNNGDLFRIYVLDQVLTYQVCDKKVILPDDTENLAAQKGEDLVSLVTCTPYGVNTHRLVVTGVRITEQKNSQVKEEKTESNWMKAYAKAMVTGCGIVGSAFVIYGIYHAKRKVKKGC